MKDHGSTQVSAKVEYGDFQTPPDLARALCARLREIGCRPASVVEPTCGTGAFVRAALETFPDLLRLEAVDANPDHLACLRSYLSGIPDPERVAVREADFFRHDWSSAIAGLPTPVLILGNPPWVTNSGLGSLGSQNLPEKRNSDGLRGIEALTGKSNFDISEWMLRRNLEWLRGKDGTLAILCKTAVARKVLLWAWRQQSRITGASIYRIDAKRYFRVNADACFLVLRTTACQPETTCADYSSLAATKPSSRFGCRDDELIADVDAYDRLRTLRARGLGGWRSGIKHDCSKVFELRRDGRFFRNGLNELVELDEEAVYPLLKSSDLANQRLPSRWILVTQTSVAEDPARLAGISPNAWKYLESHRALLEQRGSAIYRGRPPFSIFGVGPYSFAPWKVAISGLYKRLRFSVVGPHESKPVMLDDTCYFFPCEDQREANTLQRFLDAEPAQQLLSSLIFWDSKRPITATLLNSLDLQALGKLLGDFSDSARSVMHRQLVERTTEQQQLLLRESGPGYVARERRARRPTSR